MRYVLNARPMRPYVHLLNVADFKHSRQIAFSVGTGSLTVTLPPGGNKRESAVFSR
jgi:hypothetical protein